MVKKIANIGFKMSKPFSLLPKKPEKVVVGFVIGSPVPVLSVGGAQGLKNLVKALDQVGFKKSMAEDAKPKSSHAPWDFPPIPYAHPAQLLSLPTEEAPDWHIEAQIDKDLTMSLGLALRDWLIVNTPMKPTKGSLLTSAYVKYALGFWKNYHHKHTAMINSAKVIDKALKPYLKGTTAKFPEQINPAYLEEVILELTEGHQLAVSLAASRLESMECLQKENYNKGVYIGTLETKLFYAEKEIKNLKAYALAAPAPSSGDLAKVLSHSNEQLTAKNNSLWESLKGWKDWFQQVLPWVVPPEKEGTRANFNFYLGIRMGQAIKSKEVLRQVVEIARQLYTSNSETAQKADKMLTDAEAYLKELDEKN